MAVDSIELSQALAEAEDIAQSVGHKLTTAHLLLSAFTFPNRAQVLLRERGIDEDSVLSVMTGTPKEEILGAGDYAYAVPWYGERRPVLVDLLWPENDAWAERYDFVHRKGDTLYS